MIPEYCFKVRDDRILSDRSIFEEYDAVRKTHQFEKDFYNDQDSNAGPALIPVMIRNILCTKLGSLLGKPDFGIDLTPFLFEQMDWVGAIELRDAIAQSLNQNLPPSVDIEEIEILSGLDEDNDVSIIRNGEPVMNTVEINITYSYRGVDENEYFSEIESPGLGKNLNTRKLNFSLGVNGFSGFNIQENLFKRSQ